jgi:hypothetical protein
MTRVCEHGIRHPWSCYECDDAAWWAHKEALAAAAREGGDVKQAPGEAPQSGPKGNAQ